MPHTIAFVLLVNIFLYSPDFNGGDWSILNPSVEIGSNLTSGFLNVDGDARENKCVFVSEHGDRMQIHLEDERMHRHEHTQATDETKKKNEHQIVLVKNYEFCF